MMIGYECSFENKKAWERESENDHDKKEVELWSETIVLIDNPHTVKK